MKLLYSFILLIVVQSCASSSEKNGGDMVVSIDEFAPLYTEILVFDSYMLQKRDIDNFDSLYSLKFNKILDSFEVSFKEYDSTMRFYSSHYDLFKQVLEKSDSILQIKEKEYSPSNE